jgi:hypothetical protein
VIKIKSLLTTAALAAVLSGCNSVVGEALKAERDGRVINNEMMAATYPSSFRRGQPPYLERDFEAGAAFICEEIRLKRGRDLCAEKDINWR